MSWIVPAIVAVAFGLWKLVRQNPRLGVGWTVCLLMCVPVWMSVTVFGQAVNLKVLCGLVIMGAYLVHPKGSVNAKLVPVDYAVMAMIATHLASDFSHQGFGFGPVLRCYGEWCVPYFAGRLAVQQARDARNLLPLIAGVSCLLAGTAIVEAIARVNVFELLVGNRPEKGANRMAMRWGIKRAFGPTMHPIYFGCLILLTLPWTMYACVQAFRGDGKRWWMLLPLITAAGIAATATRGPILCIGVAIFGTVMIAVKKWRTGLLTATVFAAVVAGVFHRPILDTMHRLSGEKSWKMSKIVVDGEVKKYTGTMNRFYILQLYGPAMQNAGLLGYGTKATSGFPISVPIATEHEETLKKVKYVDNAYALILLRFGYAGIASFLAILGTAIWCYVKLADDSRVGNNILHACVGGTLLAFGGTIFFVWMPHDFGFYYLFLAGAGAGQVAMLKLFEKRTGQNTTTPGKKRVKLRVPRAA